MGVGDVEQFFRLAGAPVGEFAQEAQRVLTDGSFKPHDHLAVEKSPLVLFDGDCRFCRRWTDSWRRSWGARLDLEASQSACVRFPEISAPAFDSALQLVEPDGSVFSGAYAALRAQAHGCGTEG